MTTADTDRATAFYRTMTLIRQFEERAFALYAQGILRGAIHTCVGQEAVAAGVGAALRATDYLLGNHRSHGHCLAKGVSPERMLAELLGRSTGLCKGKAGSMHVCDISRGLIGCNGIVGAGLPIAVGVGLSIKLRHTDQVAVCFFGDGASNQGSFHESMNMASVWRIPTVFVCENNLYAMSTPLSSASASQCIADRAAAYSMPARTVDGMDVEAVHSAAGEYIERARTGEGPALLECLTYRYRGHSRWDPDHGLYRSKEELDAWKERDPIKAVIAKGVVTSATAEAIEVEVAEILEAAVKKAQAEPVLDPAAVLEDVFCAGASEGAFIGGAA